MFSSFIRHKTSSNICWIHSSFFFYTRMPMAYIYSEVKSNEWAEVYKVLWYANISQCYSIKYFTNEMRSGSTLKIHTFERSKHLKYLANLSKRAISNLCKIGIASLSSRGRITAKNSFQYMISVWLEKTEIFQFFSVLIYPVVIIIWKMLFPLI